MLPTPEATQFAESLTAKFADTAYAPQFIAMGGRTYDRIAQTDRNGQPASAHAFIDRTTGAVYKSASWSSPFKCRGAREPDVRYPSIHEALAAADPHGSYLYV